MYISISKPIRIPRNKVWAKLFKYCVLEKRKWAKTVIGGQWLKFKEINSNFGSPASHIAYLICIIVVRCCIAKCVGYFFSILSLEKDKCKPNVNTNHQQYITKYTPTGISLYL